MESVCIRFEEKFLKTFMKTMDKFGYSTKTEFIREAIRDKIRELEKQELLKRLDKLFGSSKHKTTDEELHVAGEKAFEKLERKFDFK